jgi:predicted GIY-YIG superfamily endonuclease
MIGRIYKLTSHQTNQCYIGSTTRSLEQRLKEHNNKKCNQYKNGRTNYLSSHAIVKFDDARIELLEEKEYKDKNEMLERERFYIESNENTVNKSRPITTKEEKKEQKDYYKEYNKIYRIDKKSNEKFDCECGGRYTRENRNAHMGSKKHNSYKDRAININITFNMTINDSEVKIITNVDETR